VAATVGRATAAAAPCRMNVRRLAVERGVASDKGSSPVVVGRFDSASFYGCVDESWVERS
jgi:hypothetical protein